ncbi:MAG: topoisomerase [Symbiobacteriaceae bacterium]|nr:topoisomerase [Symbiobacteriaceae bacterium]
MQGFARGWANICMRGGVTVSMAKKVLIIAEKPSAARAIADALGGFSRREGYLESEQYYLSWAIGHLVELKSPEEYDARWKRWSLESLPMLPSFFDLKVTTKTRSQFEVLSRLIRVAPELINACDAAREGELIFRYICQMARATQPARRLWVSSLTREAIRKAWAELRPETEYERLYQSARCRAQGDWLVGMNATRAFTVKWGELLSVGRVQTPTLALMVKREREISAFKPEEYWEVFADFATADGRKYRGKWFGPGGDRLKAAAEAEAIASRVKARPGVIESAEETPASERPPQLYDLTALQREANKRFGLTAAATLKAAQSLYEAKLITYPRTDSRYLNRDLVRTLPAVLKAAGLQTEFRALAAGANPDLVHPGNRRVVDDTKVSDHHAIIPTTEAPGTLGAVEAKVYGLVVRRFLAQFYPEARYLDTEVITRVDPAPDRFRSRGRRVLDEGWRVVEPPPAPARGKAAKGEAPEEEPRQVLPALHANEMVAVKGAEAEQKQTQPPKRFTEAALLGAMETAGRSMDDEALKEAMKGHGLGTPATRAAIIERLKDVGYIEAEKRSLVPTAKGHRLVDLAELAGAQVLLSAELTSGWEKEIADIQSGEARAERFMAEIQGLAVQIVDLVKRAEGEAGARAGEPTTSNTAGTGKARSATRRGAAGSTGTTARSSGARREGAGATGGADPGALPAFAGKCPRCGRAVVKTSRDWNCANADCTLRIPTWLCGKVVDATMAGGLLEKGRTKLIEGFKSPRTGKTFSAYLVLKEGAVGFEFPQEKPKKSSGYRRNAAGGTTGESETAKKTGSRKAGSGAARSAGGGTAKRSGGTGVGGRSSRASKPAGTGAGPD